MADITIHVLKPSVNNLTARIFVRAAGLDFEEVDAWGVTTSPEFLQDEPGPPDADDRGGGAPARARCGRAARSCSTSATSTASTRFYPADPAERAMIDSAMCYLLATVYPLLARATYPALGFPQYPGEVGASDADAETKAEAQRAAEAALAEPLEVYRTFFLDGKPFIGGSEPSIADMRLAASLEFLRAHRLRLPGVARDYMTAMEETLGDAYTEPAGDVRGYIAHVKSQVA